MNEIDVSECEFFTPTRVTVLGGGFETQIHCGQMNDFSDDAFAKNSPNLHCEKAIAQNHNYKQALDEIERYFDKRCDICREQNGIEASCDVCWKKDILGIINKAKDGNNDR